ncbi:hypothetical protein DFJ63DRAFT_139562 [Scheffersomyces coipomensis]|uniref:uncharacterized protein n=1 Tax=Scheffersomyces coipomensis TaxID=1788519 RepID=UPI00315C83F6
MTFNNSLVIPNGIFTPIPTYFKDDGDYTLDLETQVKHAKMLYKAGINGLVVSGSMGEAANITMQERCSALKAIREAVPDTNFKLIAGIPPSSYRDIIEESKLASDVGANFIIVLVPGYFGSKLVSQQGIIDYFKLVADGSSLPIMIYNYPGVVNGVDIEVSTFEELSKHPFISGVKLTHFNLDTYILLGKNPVLKANHFTSFTGLGQVLVPALSVNIKGAIDGLSGIFPKTMLKLLKLYEDGKYDQAADLQYLVTRANMMIGEFNVYGVKYALKQIYDFGDCITGRPPLSTHIDVGKYKKYQNDIDALIRYESSL